MDNVILHHVSLTTKNLSKAITFYKNVLEFSQIERPAFPLGGAWFNAGKVELHPIDFPQGSFRNTKSVGTDDVHFAIRAKDFEAMVRKLNQQGNTDELNETNNKRLTIKRKSMAGYSQLYIAGPDSHLFEINAAY